MVLSGPTISVDCEGVSASWLPFAAFYTRVTGTLDGMAAPNIRTIRFSEPDALASALRGGSIAITPVTAGPFEAKLTEFVLGDLVLQISCGTPAMMLGEVAADTVWIQLPLSGHQDLLLNGRQVAPGDFAAIAPGAGLDAVALAESRWALVVLSAETIAGLLPPPRRAVLLRPGIPRMLRASPRAWEAAMSLMEMATESAVRDPGIFEVEEARLGLRASVLEVLVVLLAGPWEDRPTRVLRTSRTRYQIIRAVEEHLRAAPWQASCPSEICAALGLSRWRVDAAFRASSAISLQRYVRLRCLAMAGAALRSGRFRHASLAEIAAAFGFRDEGHFAREYREMFGEPPSITLSHAGREAADAG
ncbi:AraC family transcriptional regulator [Roseomonas sp. M0104]|uniref:AraC family transcriptional regulator n=1 Tax=Teichococcus coralli TaxID=2545983 RepID=A0A845BF53_9PROT|nr:AraC family transcriptional regulator [Pseudoroseomonas coralli]MXP65741.1 AraC family transcriptional regulator [Pseudoroseomonas coralli]